MPISFTAVTKIPEMAVAGAVFVDSIYQGLVSEFVARTRLFTKVIV